MKPSKYWIIPWITNKSNKNVRCNILQRFGKKYAWGYAFHNFSVKYFNFKKKKRIVNSLWETDLIKNSCLISSSCITSINFASYFSYVKTKKIFFDLSLFSFANVSTFKSQEICKLFLAYIMAVLTKSFDFY